MNTASADFAIFGSTPLARLLAGLLASRHGKKVVLVGEVKARYRLPRVADLSVGAITRPQTWALLQSLVPETTRLIGKMGGRTAHRHVDPIFFAESAEAREALGHVAGMARAFGMIVENLSSTLLGADRMALRISDAVAINRPAVEPAMEAWLSQCGVMVLSTPSVELTPDGGAVLRQGEMETVAAKALFADDAAIETYVPPETRPALLVEHLHSTILTASGKHLASPIMAHFDSGAWLVEHEEGGMAAMGPGNLASFSRNLIALLNQPTQLEQAGQVTFRVFSSRDNAPIVVRLTEGGPVVLVGLDGWGTFLVPALARWFAGEATFHEAAWFRAHAPHRPEPVAEFAAQAEDMPA